MCHVVKLHMALHHGVKYYNQNFSKNLAVGMTPQSQTPVCHAHQGVRLSH